MPKFALLLCVVLLQYSSVSSAEHSMNGTVYFDSQTNKYSIKLDVIDCVNGIVCGYFNDSLNKTGWGVLEIKSDYKLSSDSVTDYNRMFAAGLLEGYLSSYEIYWGYYTAWQGMGDLFLGFEKELINWLQTQRNWMDQQINKYSSTDPYWNYVKLLTAQFDGEQYGYNNASADFHRNIPALNNFQFQFINGNQDLVGVTMKIILENTKLSFAQKRAKIKQLQSINQNSRCSAIVKITPELDNIFFAHSTWSNYFWMNRVYKHYIIKTKATSVKMEHYTMCSYPGALSSIDDFYIMDTGLAVTETTNGIFNLELYSELNPETLFTWQRVRISNAICNTGPQWVNTFTRYNSGTYNNQWIILNYNLFKSGEPLKDNILWIAEQIPGNVSCLDVTNILERGYWSSYNVPSIEYIYKESGFEAKARVDGPSASYDLAPRARITRRDANKCNNMTMIKKLMRYNNYKNDPLEQNNPTWAMMNRADLLASDEASAFGGVDTKIADLSNMLDVSSVTQAGPTYDDVTPFTWNTSQWINEPHIGLPMTYDFDWVLMKSKLTYV
eukprot:239147_1